jgi:hypothetical protein
LSCFLPPFLVDIALPLAVALMNRVGLHEQGL